MKKTSVTSPATNMVAMTMRIAASVPTLSQKPEIWRGDEIINCVLIVRERSHIRLEIRGGVPIFGYCKMYRVPLHVYLRQRDRGGCKKTINNLKFYVNAPLLPQIPLLYISDEIKQYKFFISNEYSCFR